jgi:multidrug efflux system membrane fusion protein
MDEPVNRTTTAPTRPPLENPLHTRPSRRRGLLTFLLLLVVVGVAVALWLRTGQNGAPGRPTFNALPPQAVRTAVATTGNIAITLNALGTVTSLSTVTVQSQISGRIQQIGFQEGQMVKAGDFLAQIDDRPYQAALEQAQGQLQKDQGLLAQAQSDLTRYQTLAKQDSIALQQVADQQFLVTQDQGAIAADQAQIDADKLNITYCHIVSPTAGRVGLRQIDAGNYVLATSTTGIVVVTQMQPISVIFSIPEDDLPQVMQRMAAGAQLQAIAFDRSNTTQLATGVLQTTDNQIDTTTGTIKLRASFANTDNALFPNQFVNVQLLVDTERGAILVPNAAIQQGTSGSYVYLVKPDGTVAVQNVVTGPADPTNTSVMSGLSVGDEVVIDGTDRLRDGARIVVRNGNGQAAAAPNPEQQRQNRRRSGATQGQ